MRWSRWTHVTINNSNSYRTTAGWRRRYRRSRSAEVVHHSQAVMLFSLIPITADGAIPPGPLVVSNAFWRPKRMTSGGLAEVYSQPRVREEANVGLKAGKAPEPKGGRLAPEDLRESLPKHGSQRSLEKLRCIKVSNPYLDL